MSSVATTAERGGRETARGLTMPLSVRLALRELRGGISGFYIFVTCIALGATAIAAVGTLSSAIQYAISREGRVLLGGDVEASLVHRQATPEERRVFASAILLYGMSLLFGVAGDTRLTEIGAAISGTAGNAPMVTLAIVFTVIGFAFKVSAVPFHTWAPDTYEGAPTPITAFLAVASKAAGFVALLQVIFIAFPGRTDVIEPLMWVLAAATMTIGNMIALRQTNVIRMLAYSGVAQAGFMLAPLAVGSDLSARAVVTYLVIYAAMNLGAFACVIGIARKTHSAEISSFGGLFEYAPGMTVVLTLFLFSLAGIPPLGGWLAKFVVFRTLADANTASGYVLGAIVAVNSVIALYYYANVARQMWMNPPPDDDRAPVVVPFSIQAAIGLTIVATVAFGVSDLATRLGDGATFLFAAIG